MEWGICGSIIGGVITLCSTMIACLGRIIKKLLKQQDKNFDRLYKKLNGKDKNGKK